MNPPNKNRIISILVIPALIFMVMFFLLPLIFIVVDSVYDESGAFTFINYVSFFQSPKLSKIYWRTLRIAFIVTAMAVVVGYPVAWSISRMPPGRQSMILMLFMVPRMTNMVARGYAWLIILGRSGPINLLLQWLGVIDEPLRMMYTEPAIVFGLFQILLPLMVLNITSALENIPNDLIEAARTLGASRLKAFIRVIVPLSTDGLVTGGSLVFTICVASYTIPKLLGGDRIMVMPTLMRQLTSILDWDGAMVASVVLTLSAIAINLFLRSLRPKLD